MENSALSSYITFMLGRVEEELWEGSSCVCGIYHLPPQEEWWILYGGIVSSSACREEEKATGPDLRLEDPSRREGLDLNQPHTLNCLACKL